MEPIGLMIKNFYYYADVHPVQTDDDFLVPVSVLFNALKGKSQWSKDKTTYTAELMGSVYVFTNSTITANGVEFTFKEILEAVGDLLLDMTTMKQLVAEEGDIHYDKFSNKIRVNVAVESVVPDLPDSIINEYPNAVQVEAVIGKGYATLPKSNALDSDTSTRWCKDHRMYF